MMDERAYWMGDPLLVVNFNVSWNQYASLQILERVPEALDLAERMGADESGIDKWRENLFGGIVHYWNEMFFNDSMDNSKYFDPALFITRMKHIKNFTEYIPKLEDIYKRAHESNHPRARLNPTDLFAAFTSH